MNFTANDVEQMIEEQRTYFYTGDTKPAAFRIEQLLRLKSAIQSHKAEVIEALKNDLGKSEFEAYATEVGFVLDSISSMAKNLEEWMKPEQVKTPIHLQPSKSFVIREPYGSVLVIGPFNYPFQLVMEPLIGAIIGGNCAVVKPSEATPNVAKAIRTIIEEAFPAYYIRVVEGEREEVTALIHASFDYIFFTGSVNVGKVIMKAASERLTPITLELGGKSPAIVDQTANLDLAAKRIAWGKLMNTGQTCVAPDYICVHESVKDEFLKKLTKTIQDFYGKDAQRSPDYGRIVNHQHFDRLAEIVQKESGNIIYGGKMDRSDRYIEPVVLDNITWDSPSMEDEIFGPILPIISYTDLPLLLRQIRKLPKPLSAYLFSENDRAVRFFLDQLPFGGGCINDTVSHVGSSYLPFGGVGTSGINSYHGKASFETFTHAKSILKKSTKFSVNIVFPPYKNKAKWIKTVLR
ncbi:aldehyde dehydrogenase (NAD+) [Planomicrobium stackebrandtii]|uniref:Aldehyde dehydrogenase n=1 Tax=Planomicrobium stackebrandtii TaxID=253160 RepID=A0ABU0GUR1_9BACL|nr:aldehyde dehydrogenase [Planomicrobium stackebrandtii]MDQ0429094.1 aldehyde dehydrogenase (NAD+) [Planomicrobium stackebrandtii]